MFDAFSVAEDPDGRISGAVLEHARPGGREVLEVGAGTGRLAKELAGRASRYVAIEPALPMARLAQRNAGSAVHVLRARAEELPLRDGCVDLAIAGWVFAFLPVAVRARAIDAVSRVVRPSGALWLIENHWDSEFQALRGRPPERDRSEVAPLLALGFGIAATVETQIRFASEQRCLEVMGYLCGDAAAERLRERPRASIAHRVVLLRR